MQLLYNPFIEICAFGFLLTVTVFFFIKENLFTIQSILYGIFLILVLFSLSLDILTAFTISYGRIILHETNIILNTFLFFFNLCSSLILYLFTVALTDGLGTFRRRIVLNIILLIPFIAGIVLLILNFNSGCIFYFDKYHIYHHGSMYLPFCLLGSFYVLCGLIHSVYKRKAITLIQLITIIFYTVLVIAAVIFQYFYPKILLLWAFSALGLISMYFTFQNPDTYIDGLTKIFGRSAFLVVVGQTVKWQGEPFRIIIIDINAFKTVNSHFGILVGDNIIISIVEFLQSIVPGKRSLFRIGGAQYALLLEEDEADRCLEQIRRRFKYSWAIMDNKLTLSVSIAMISISNYSFSKDFLMQIIDNSLMLAKEAGSGSYIAVDEEVIASIKRTMRIENCLHDFEINNSLKIYFQPIYNVEKKRIASAEILLRMYDEELGFVSPDEFIHVAERLGMINSIGRFVLKETCRFIYENKLRDRGIETLELNLSAAECMQENYGEYIKEVFSSYPFEKDLITFEITETIAASVWSNVSKIMSVLKPIGIKFALDDYSQGYANIQALITLPFNSIKLDKELLWNALNSEKANIIFRHTVKMFKDLGLKIICEGAETEEHVKFLYDLKIDYIQGYYFGKPLSKEDFIDEVLNLNAGT